MHKKKVDSFAVLIEQDADGWFVGLQNVERIDLLVSDSNPAALALYKKHDFETAGTLDRNLWEQGLLVYSKKVAGAN